MRGSSLYSRQTAQPVSQASARIIEHFRQQHNRQAADSHPFHSLADCREKKRVDEPPSLCCYLVISSELIVLLAGV
jgi:hypothetical protein